jgi:hypothetical protein
LKKGKPFRSEATREALIVLANLVLDWKVLPWRAFGDFAEKIPRLPLECLLVSTSASTSSVMAALMIDLGDADAFVAVGLGHALVGDAGTEIEPGVLMRGGERGDFASSSSVILL